MQKQKKIKVLYISPEISPFAKVGGLADVAGSLPIYLNKENCDVRVVMPKYKCIDEKKYKLKKTLDSFTVSTGDKYYFPLVYKGKLVNSDQDLFFLAEDELFGRENVYGYADDCKRFAFFGKACLEFCKTTDFKPDIIHLNDWHDSIIALLGKTLYKNDPFFAKTKTILTLHNIQYQGIAPLDILQYLQISKDDSKSIQLDSENNDIDFLMQGILNSDAITTVSKTYAEEILTPEYGYGMETFLKGKKEHIFGIINGIDTKVWDPKTDPTIIHNYDVNNINEGKKKNKLELQRVMGLPEDENIPVIGIVSRLAEQKGFDLIMMAAERLFLDSTQLVILGSGEPKIEAYFTNLKRIYPKKCAVNLLFDESFARKIYAGSDFFLMPSKFEPCGLGQLIAMRYGSIPIVRSTGGLADTVTPITDIDSPGDGFVFKNYDSRYLFEAIQNALTFYKNKKSVTSIRERIMRKDFSWKASAKEYVETYKKILSLDFKF